MNSNVNFTEEEIRGVLKEYSFYQALDFTTEDFCDYKQLDKALLQEWIEKYPDYADDGFIDVNLVRNVPQQPTVRKLPATAATLFAKVGDIEIYQQMPAAFLKSLRP